MFDINWVIYKLLYKLYNSFENRVSCVRAITDNNGSGNVMNIKIHTSNESLAMAQEDMPLRDLNSQTPEAIPRRSIDCALRNPVFKTN